MDDLAQGTLAPGRTLAPYAAAERLVRDLRRSRAAAGRQGGGQPVSSYSDA